MFEYNWIQLTITHFISIQAGQLCTEKTALEHVLSKFCYTIVSCPLSTSWSLLEFWTVTHAFEYNWIQLTVIHFISLQAGQLCTDKTALEQGLSKVGYTCVGCPSGLELQGDTCVDTNECNSPSLHGCDHTCTNVPGSYTCGCRDGYRLATDGRTCTDVNECAEQTSGE